VFTQILVEFLFRLTFGVAAAMALTSSRWVTSGFFRVHLWVLLGVQTLAALAVYSATSASAGSGVVHRAQLGLAIGAAAISYVGAVIWMYEQRTLGKLAIIVVAGCALAGCTLPALVSGTKPIAFQLADRVAGGLVLGFVSTAMLLGHWYLNTPTMKLEPLKRLIVFLAAAVALRMAVSGGGAWLEATMNLAAAGTSPLSWGPFLALRWLAGLVGVLGLAGLTWQTLKIPNTQSATGILYAAMILAFIGELTSQLLSAQTRYPL
jgi:hypothetical protein